MAHVSLENQLKKLLKDKGISGLKLESGETIEQVLKKEAQRLIEILKEEINNAVYSRPASLWYDRTNDLMDSVDENISIDPKTNTITIGFLDDKAWHDSWITKNPNNPNSNYNRPAYAPMAVIEGYEVFNTGHKIVGVDFIKNAIDRFNREKRRGITVRVEGKEALIGAWWR